MKGSSEIWSKGYRRSEQLYCIADHRKEGQMIFFLQMRWNIEGRLSFKEVWDLEIEESKAAQSGFKVLGMYKVAGQKRGSRGRGYSIG